MTNLTELSKKVYQLQIEKGWCKPDEKRDIEDLKILILSEAFEAFEAYRKGNYCQLKKDTHLSTILYSLNSFGGEGVKVDTSGFKHLIKDTFEDEIADVAIRALDLAGYLGVNVSELHEVRAVADFPKELIRLTEMIATTLKVGCYFVNSVLRWCYAQSIQHDFDLMQHIELKLAYNKTRPFRHGGKVV